MAFAFFDSRYVPCGFLIVADDGDPYDDCATTLVDSDWEFPSVAQAMGAPPCCEGSTTDGTVDCRGCGAPVSDLISRAYDFIRANAGVSFAGMDEFLTNQHTAGVQQNDAS